MFKLFTIILTLFFVNVLFLSARSYNVNQLPNGSKFSCNTCHTAGSTGSLNKFGQDIKKNYYSGNQVNWVAAIANLDSDGDGVTNGQELLDPQGAWTIGSSNPGNSDDVTNPGDANSKPTSILDNETNLNNSSIIINSIYPNPVCNKAIINFEMKYSDFISIKLYDLKGNEIQNVFLGFKNSGIQNFVMYINSLNNNKFVDGIYMMVIQSGYNYITEKLVIQKE